MRTWDRLSASFVKGLRKPGKHYDGGGLMLLAAATARKGVVNKAWLFRFQIDKRERVMGLGSARVVSLAEARAKANECRKLLATVKLIARLPRKGEYLFTVNGNGKPIVAMSLRKALFRHGGDGFTVHGFRSAFRTWSDEHTNYPRELKEVALAHAIGNQTEAAYARGDLLEKRRKLMQAWATHCAAPAARTTGKVVSLRGGRGHA